MTTMSMWRPDMVRFMRDAATHSDYNARLRDMMLPYLHPQDSICDAGCGLGYLSLALAPYVRQITAIDQSESAIAVLRENCAAQRIGNVCAQCERIENVTVHAPFDAMIFCLYGQLHEILDISRRMCRGNILIVKRNEPYHRFSAGMVSKKADGYAGAAERLRAMGVPFEEKEMTLSLNQPFRNMEDARRFFRLYSQDKNKRAAAEDYLRNRLRETDDPAFPLEMPMQRNLALITLNANSL